MWRDQLPTSILQISNLKDVQPNPVSLEVGVSRLDHRKHARIEFQVGAVSTTELFIARVMEWFLYLSTTELDPGVSHTLKG